MSTLDKVVITSVILFGVAGALLFALLLSGFDVNDPHDRCTTKQYTSIRVCDMSK